MVELFYLVGMFRTLSLEGRISVALRKLLQGRNRGLVGRGCGGSQAIYKFVTKGAGSLNIKDQILS